MLLSILIILILLLSEPWLDDLIKLKAYALSRNASLNKKIVARRVHHILFFSLLFGLFGFIFSIVFFGPQGLLIFLSGAFVFWIITDNR